MSSSAWSSDKYGGSDDNVAFDLSSKRPLVRKKLTLASKRRKESSQPPEDAADPTDVAGNSSNDAATPQERPHDDGEPGPSTGAADDGDAPQDNCPVCGIDIGDLASLGRQAHVNSCLDGSSSTDAMGATSAPPDSLCSACHNNVPGHLAALHILQCPARRPSGPSELVCPFCDQGFLQPGMAAHLRRCGNANGVTSIELVSVVRRLELDPESFERVSSMPRPRTPPPPAPASTRKRAVVSIEQDDDFRDSSLTSVVVDARMAGQAVRRTDASDLSLALALSATTIPPSSSRRAFTTRVLPVRRGAGETADTARLLPTPKKGASWSLDEQCAAVLLDVVDDDGAGALAQHGQATLPKSKLRRAASLTQSSAVPSQDEEIDKERLTSAAEALESPKSKDTNRRLQLLRRGRSLWTLAGSPDAVGSGRDNGGDDIVQRAAAPRLEAKADSEAVDILAGLPLMSQFVHSSDQQATVEEALGRAAPHVRAHYAQAVREAEAERDLAIRKAEERFRQMMDKLASDLVNTVDRGSENFRRDDSIRTPVDDLSSDEPENALQGPLTEETLVQDIQDDAGCVGIDSDANTADRGVTPPIEGDEQLEDDRFDHEGRDAWNEDDRQYDEVELDNYYQNTDGDARPDGAGGPVIFNDDDLFSIHPPRATAKQAASQQLSISSKPPVPPVDGPRKATAELEASQQPPSFRKPAVPLPVAPRKAAANKHTVAQQPLVTPPRPAPTPAGSALGDLRTPEYVTMPTPQLAAAASKFGLRPAAARRVLAAHLAAIWRSEHRQPMHDTHKQQAQGSQQVSEAVSNGDDDADDDEDDEESDEEIDVSVLDLEEEVEEEQAVGSVAPRGQGAPGARLTISDCRSLVAHLREFRPDVVESILMFMPIDITLLLGDLKAAGVRAKADDIAAALDDMGVAFVAPKLTEAVARRGRSRTTQKTKRKAVSASQQ